MKYFEFGQENEKLMVLLHGGGVCYRGAIPTAEVLAREFHVIVVAYDGFNPSEPDKEFTTVMDEARWLGDYVVENYGGTFVISPCNVAKLEESGLLPDWPPLECRGI